MTALCTMPASKRPKTSGFLAPAASGSWDGFTPLVGRSGPGTQSSTSSISLTTSSRTRTTTSLTSVLPTGQDRIPAAPSLVTALVPALSETARRDLPTSCYSRRADPSRALATLTAPGGREQLLSELQKGFSAASSSTGKVSLLTTWSNFHDQWFGEAVPMYPLTVDGLLAVSALFKKAGYRSYPNYLSAVKSEHILRGHVWS